MTDHTPTRRRGRSHALRFIILGAVFAVICLVYAARLMKLQLEDTPTFFEYPEGDLISYTVTVKANRGALCDRNGTVINVERKARLHNRREAAEQKEPLPSGIWGEVVLELS